MVYIVVETFSLSVDSEDQETEDSKQFNAAITMKAILYMNRKKPGKHTMATAAHTGDTPLV